MTDFHIEERPAGAIFLRAISAVAHDWIAVHPISGDKVLGGAIIQRAFADAILSDIARDGLVSVRVMPAMVRGHFS